MPAANGIGRKISTVRSQRPWANAAQDSGQRIGGDEQWRHDHQQNHMLQHVGGERAVRQTVKRPNECKRKEGAAERETPDRRAGFARP